MSYNFTIPQKQALHSNAPQAKTRSATMSAWESACKDAVLKKTATHKGVTYKLYVEPSEAKDIEAKKLKTLHSAIEHLQDAGIMFANGDVKEFRVVLYSGNGYLGKQPSRGVVWFDTPTEAKPTVMLQLGARVCAHTKAQDKTSPGAGGAIGGTSMPPRIVADRMYDYYTAARTVSASDRSALVQAFHEFGHIFHQLSGTDQYFIGADLFMGQAKTQAAGKAWSPAHIAAARHITTAERVGKTYVSQYAGNGQTNEFVAETFSGLMMGVPWAQVHADVLTTYAHFNGPLPPTPRTLKRLADFKTKQCGCTKSTSGSSIVYYGKWG